MAHINHILGLQALSGWPIACRVAEFQVVCLGIQELLGWLQQFVAQATLCMSRARRVRGFEARASSK